MSADPATGHPHASGSSNTGVLVAIVGLVIAYAVGLSLGLPQLGTRLIVEHAHHGQASHEVADLQGHDVHAEHQVTDHAEHDHAEHDHAPPAQPAATEADAAHAPAAAPPLWMVTPFVLLLGAIAIFPLLSATEMWWESNLNRFKVAAGLGLITLLYYGFLHHSPIDGHWPFHYQAEPSQSGFQLPLVKAILGNAILSEFIPFITLLFSLYVISGGIRISGDLRANPMTNAAFMAVGGLLASFIGTTGAAMVLIRPLLETNKERHWVVHTVIFFIFVVCNCGGCLLPIGDPPLFLGYLEGVPFTWTMFALWKPWLLANGLLIGLYLLIDQLWYYRRETVADIYEDITHTTRLRFEGLGLNLPLLVGVVLAVALLDPTKAFPGTDMHPWMYSREIVQLALVAVSLGWGSAATRRKNAFNYHAILEVAALFSGIFICMQPALQILAAYGGEIGRLVGAEGGVLSTAHYFWITGGLSSVLDNAPTYLVFFKLAEATTQSGAVLVPGTNVEPAVLVAISLGSVFMGAMTYIGNGPNFMVRAIAEASGVKMPSFFGYVAYSVLFLLPVLAIVAWQFV